MGCLLVAVGALAPRLAVFLIWLARPGLVDAAFDTFLIPLLGIIFLPFTTLVYLIVFTPGIGVTGSDWIWIGLAVVLDVAHLTASVADRRYRSGWRDE